MAVAVATVAAGPNTASAAEGNWHTIVNGYSGQCVIVGEPGNGAPVVQVPCNELRTGSKSWNFVPTKDNKGARAYFIRNETTDKCMGVSSSLDSGPVVIQYTCNGSVDQKWWVPSNSLIRNVYSGKCLGVGSSKAVAKRLIQWPCNSSSIDQLWATPSPFYDGAPFEGEAPSIPSLPLPE
ncbi:RICIN domain-containing protein [Kitasatospora sp. NPDC096147]|uniref:RICIN domain-containing protein n=1 Tax=Kitasatospora sp. NPDC096147 TaxID=3364093 RepID=UPI00382AABC5